jgi:YegS/Rv2252/BmrU family lipid kinase
MDKALNIHRIRIIVNPASGQPEPVLHTLNRVFHPLDLEWDIAITQNSGDARQLAEEAAGSGIDVVAAYGGDGTVMEVAHGLMGTEVPMAILPGGTANLMSVELRIPRKLEEAAGLIGDPHTQVQKIDLGQSGERLFMLRVGMGYDAEMIRLADREKKDRFGILAYIISGVEALLTTKMADYHITIDGQEFTHRGFICRIDNSGNMGVQGVSIAPDISVTDGLLDLLILGTADIKELYHTLRQARSDTALVEGLREAYQRWQGREISVVADPPQTLHADGEVWGETPVSVKVLPQAVSVLVPPQ